MKLPLIAILFSLCVLCFPARAEPVGTYTLKLDGGYSLQFLLMDLVSPSACEAKGKMIVLIQMHPTNFPLEATRAGFACWHAYKGSIIVSDGRLTSTSERINFTVPTKRVVVAKDFTSWKDWGINVARQNPPSARPANE